MKKAWKILIILLLGFTLNLNAQTLDTLISKSANLNLSYNSSVIYPGARFGFEFPVRNIELTKKKVNKDRFITAQIGWYHHPSFHDNFYFTTGWTMRRIQPCGFFTQFSPEIGYSRTFLGGTTYRLDENNNVGINKMAGYNYLLTLIGVGLGYDLEITKNKPIAIYSKFNVLLMYPYNSNFYLRPTIELGLIYKPKNLFIHTLYSKTK